MFCVEFWFLLLMCLFAYKEHYTVKLLYCYKLLSIKNIPRSFTSQSKMVLMTFTWHTVLLEWDQLSVRSAELYRLDSGSLSFIIRMLNKPSFKSWKDTAIILTSLRQCLLMQSTWEFYSSACGINSNEASRWPYFYIPVKQMKVKVILIVV